MRRLLATLLTIFCVVSMPGATGNVCSSNLAVLSYQTAWNEFETTLENPSPVPESGGLIVEFTMYGQTHRWWFDGIDVPPTTTWQVEIEFPSIITVIDVEACQEKVGHGVIDAPDPVANKLRQRAH